MMHARLAAENVDTVSLVSALLVRYPEIASIRATPSDRSVRLSFAVRKRLDREAQARIAESLEDHIGAFLCLHHEEPTLLAVTTESDRAMSFVHLVRDLESFGKPELEMVAALFATQFGDALVRMPSEVGQDAEDLAAQDEIAEYAIEALRDPEQSKSLVGFREEQRVLVYFIKTRKKGKATGRR